MNKLFQILALCMALGLGGGFVWWQQKQAVPALGNPEAQPIISDEKPAVPVLLPGSKSGTYRLKQEEQEEQVLLPSSKNITMPVFKSRLAPAASPEKQEP